MTEAEEMESNRKKNEERDNVIRAFSIIQGSEVEIATIITGMEDTIEPNPVYNEILELKEYLAILSGQLDDLYDLVLSEE